jgi:acyl-CoA thioesterase FadM
MSGFKLSLPDQFRFSTQIKIRITDLNYGGHVGNDAILSIIHEARMQFLNHFQLSELEFSGFGLIMADVVIEFKAESFFGDILEVYVTAANFSRAGFDLYYALKRQQTEQGKEVTIAIAKTGMVCYDYPNKKVVSVPEGIKELLLG